MAKKNFLQKLKDRQKNQPKLGTELRAAFREGREDFLSVIMGGLAGTNRETGAPGTPTPQQVTENLKGRKVNKSTDQLTGKKVTLEQLRNRAKGKEAEGKMEGQQRKRGGRQM